MSVSHHLFDCALRWLGVAAVAALTGCAAFAPTPYGPAAHEGGYGFRSEPLTGERWRIVVRGNAATDAATVRDQWLLRAAEIALAAGAESFTIVGPRRHPDISPAFVMPQFGAATGGFRPLVRIDGYAPGVVPSRQLVAEGEIELAAGDGFDARRLCRALTARFPNANCPPAP